MSCSTGAMVKGSKEVLICIEAAIASKFMETQHACAREFPISASKRTEPIDVSEILVNSSID